MERFAGDQIGDITLMQMFPWFGTLSAARDEASQLALASYEKFRNAGAEVFYEIKQIWWDLHMLDADKEIKQQQLHLLQTVEQIATNNVRAGIGSTSEVLAIKMEQNVLTAELEYLDDKFEVLLVKFNKLLNREAHQHIEINDKLSDIVYIDADSLIFEDLIANNPTLRRYKIEQAAFQAMEVSRRRMSLPEFGLGLNYSIFESNESVGSTMNGKNMLMPVVSLSLPIWRKKYKASIREAEILQQSANYQQVAAENFLTTEFKDAINLLRQSKREINLYKEQTELAEQIIDILLSDYISGKNEFEQIIRMQQQLADYRLNTAKAYRDNKMALATIEKIKGDF